MTVVIADDSSLLRDRICKLIKGLNGSIVTCEAENGQRAIQLICSSNPDLVILDIRLPEMSGIEVLKRIKELKIQTRICVLTTFSFPQYRKKCLELGADYFLDKNMEFENISGILGQLKEEHQNDYKTL